MESIILLVLLALLWIVFVTIGSIVALSHRNDARMLEEEILSLRKRLVVLESTKKNNDSVPQSTELLEALSDEQAQSDAETFVNEFISDKPIEPELVMFGTSVNIAQAMPAIEPTENHEETFVEEFIDKPIEPESQRQEPHTSSKNISKTIDSLRTFLIGGNIWVTGGVILVVLGIAFLYSYVASIYHVPAALKIAAGMLVGLAFFAVGWKQRIKRRTFAMVVQGGGIGIFYLSLFASAKIYTVFPVSVAFALIAVLIALAVIISVLQKSEVLALFAVIIGYCAPLLLSDGSGNYIVLFTYYGIIGLAVLAIAIKQYWRYLNSISFVFTFAMLAYWIIKRITPEQFWPLELFLVCFFLIFTAINILASLRQQSKIKHAGFAVIENTYALTLSFTYISLQMYIAQLYQYGQAIASLTLGIFYIAFSYWLVRRYKEQLRQLVLLYLALGIVFVNFALPFALEGDWTAGIWAVEGAALVVLGVYQSNRLFRCFGTTLSLLAVYMAFSMDVQVIHTPFVNNAWVVCFLAAVSLIVEACAYNRRVSGALVTEYSALAYCSLGLGLILWYSVFGREIVYIHNDSFSLPMLALLLVSLSALLFDFVAHKVRWPQLRFIAATPLIVAAAIALFQGFNNYEFFYPAELILDLDGLFGWLSFFGVSIVFIYQYFIKETHLPEKVRMTLATTFIFIAIVFISANVARPALGSFWYFAVAMLSSALLIGLSTTRYALRIPLFSTYRFYGTAAVAAYLLLAVLFSLALPMQGVGLPFLNVLDLTILATLATIIYWLIFWKHAYRQEPLWRYSFNTAFVVAGVVAFIWLHCALARGVRLYEIGSLFYSMAYMLSLTALWGVASFGLIFFGKKLAQKPLLVTGAVAGVVAFILTHITLARGVRLYDASSLFHSVSVVMLWSVASFGLMFSGKKAAERPLWLAGVVGSVVVFILIHWVLACGVQPYGASQLFHSAAYQLSIAILWAITGFALMLLGKKFAKRPLWVAGAVLLACDSVKLLLIDLSNAGTLPRIGSFMAVGLIFIVIGYFVPLPPKRGEDK